MSRNPYTVSPDTSIKKVQEIFKNNRFWSVYVVESGKLLGIITRSDLSDRGAYFVSTQPVKTIMSESVYSIDSDADIDDAASRIFDLNVNGLAVIENGELCGIITRFDLRKIGGSNHATAKLYNPQKVREKVNSQPPKRFPALSTFIFCALLVFAAIYFFGTSKINSTELNLTQNTIEKTENLLLNGTNPQTSNPTPNIVIPQMSVGSITSDLNTTKVELSVHSAINSQRTENGLNELAWNQKLSDIAREHSKDMALRGYFQYSGEGHIDPEGHDFVWRMNQAGFKCNIVEYNGNVITTWNGAENLHQMDGINLRYTFEDIVRGYDGPVQGWMRSPPHRAQILEPRWKTEGIGMYVLTNGNNQQIYFTELFC